MTGLTPDTLFTWLAIASASACVSDWLVPAPWLTPPTREALGMIVSTFGPSAPRRLDVDALAPWLIEIITITAPTPMIMPSVVKSERSLLVANASSALAAVCHTDAQPRRLVFLLPRVVCLLLRFRRSIGGGNGSMGGWLYVLDSGSVGL